LDDQLLQAYRNTDYRVAGEPTFTIRIGKRCVALEALLSARGMAEAAFLTAWNPWSQPTSEADNLAAQKRLESDLAAAGYAVLSGEGIGDGGDWPPEPSALILGITRDRATELSKAYGQNAYVHIRSGQPAELILTHP
jgi:hypothetical protein